MKETPLVPRVLTKDEFKEYERLRLGPLTIKEQYAGAMKHYGPAFLSLLLMLVCAFGVWYSTRNLEVQADGNDTDLSLSLVGMLVAMVSALVFAVKGIGTQAAERLSGYLDSIDYEQRSERFKPVEDRGSGGSSYEPSYSRNYENHLWYGDHSEMDWRDREQAQSWGMDADTYASNWLEND